MSTSLPRQYARTRRFTLGTPHDFTIAPDGERVAFLRSRSGGYLAALAVLRRPDVFHAAAAGAPVTDQRLYNTHWNERYLGHPDDSPEAYDQSSLSPRP